LTVCYCFRCPFFAFHMFFDFHLLVCYVGQFPFFPFQRMISSRWRLVERKQFFVIGDSNTHKSQHLIPHSFFRSRKFIPVIWTIFLEAALVSLFQPLRLFILSQNSIFKLRFATSGRLMWNSFVDLFWGQPYLEIFEENPFNQQPN
jgi:hypothetical protein